MVQTDVKQSVVVAVYRDQYCSAGDTLGLYGYREYEYAYKENE